MTNVCLYKSRCFVTTWHLIAFIQYVYAIYYDINYVNIPHSVLPVADNDFSKRFKYYTYWCLIIQTVYFAISILNDFIGTNEISPKKLPLIRKLKDRLLAILAFPCALGVSIMFWLLMAIDRELVFPKVLDLYFPSWLNHVLHTNILIFIILELCTSFRTYPDRGFGMKVLSAFMFSYIVWLHFIYYHTGHWVYPLFEMLPTPLRIIFLVMTIIFTNVLYVFGEFINEKIWTKEMKLVAKKSK